MTEPKRHLDPVSQLRTDFARLVASSDASYSADTPEVVQAALAAWEARDAREQLQHVRYEGGHALTPERTEKIIAWVITQAR